LGKNIVPEMTYTVSTVEWDVKPQSINQCCWPLFIIDWPLQPHLTSYLSSAC